MPDAITIMGNTGGNQAYVTDKGALWTGSPDKTEVYMWNTVSTDIAAAGTALLICNNSDTKHLHIIRAYVWADVATEIDFHLPVYSASFTGTAVAAVPINRQAKGIDAPMVAWDNETANDQTALIATIHTNETATDIFGNWVELDGLLVLGYHDSLAIDIVADSAAFNAVVIGYFENDH